METLLTITQVVIVLAIVGGAIATLSHRWQSKFSPAHLALVFFTFGLVCGVFAIFSQYSDAYQVGTLDNFANANFYLSLGILSVLSGIFLKTDKR